jgi:hypothetical protein
MGFQTGTQIRPELMRGDMSGFTEAARLTAQTGQMWGQALEKVGQQVAGAIKQKQEKADKKAKDEAAARVLMSHIPGMTYADALAGVNGVGAETLLNMNEQNMQREAKAKEAQATADYRSAALGVQGGQLKVAQEAETRLGAASAATQVNEAARLKMAQDAANRPVDPMVAAQAQADLDKTKAATAEATARTGQVGQMSTAERVKLMGTVVDDVSFGDYLQTLKKVDEYDGGREWNVKGSVFDKKQIAAFDNVIRDHPEFIADMPKAVKDYFGYTNTPGGGTLRITKR